MTLADVGIDYTPAYFQGGGVGRYVRELVGALALEDEELSYRLWVAGVLRSALPDVPGVNFGWRTVPVSMEWWLRIWYRARVWFPVEVVAGRARIFHATDFVLPPTLFGTTAIVTVYDLSFVRAPESSSPRLRAFLNRVVPGSVGRADCVLVDSRMTRDDLVELYGVDGDKIVVLWGGVDKKFVPVFSSDLFMTMRSKYTIGERPYILSVGTVQPRKNYSRLIQAVWQLRSQGYDLDLVISGGRGWLEDAIYETIKTYNMQEHVHMIGYADDADLPALYSGAVCVALPSLYEGFGLPVLEAMACGTPVVTSNVSSLPEVAGDAAVLVDPYDVEAIAHAIQTVVDDEALRQRLITGGLERASQFTWSRAAKQLMALYRDLLGS
jgi:glycosyltransferase involved in cell wall biosynthesis